jgi:AbrB family looped-hinge helix DNA binding protein
MKVTRKGQVTIPKEIRDRCSSQPGTAVDFVVEGNTVRLIPITPSTPGLRLIEQ